MFKPVFVFSFVCGMTPFSITGVKFRESKWSVLWSGTLLIICCILPAIAFASRTFESKKIFIYNVTDFMQAWLSAINVITTVVTGYMQRKKVKFQKNHRNM